MLGVTGRDLVLAGQDKPVAVGVIRGAGGGGRQQPEAENDEAFHVMFLSSRDMQTTLMGPRLPWVIAVAGYFPLSCTDCQSTDAGYVAANPRPTAVAERR